MLLFYGKKVTWICRIRRNVPEASDNSNSYSVNQNDETPAMNLSECGTLILVKLVDLTNLIFKTCGVYHTVIMYCRCPLAYTTR